MKSRLLILMSVLLSQCACAQNKHALINDVDGFTYIRSGPGINFSVEDTLFERQFFTVQMADSADWCLLLFRQNMDSGYIHRSKIQAIEDLDANELWSVLNRIFIDHKIYGDDFQAICGQADGSEKLSEECIKRRNLLIDYTESFFYPSLPVFTDFFCSNPDAILLENLYNALWSHSGSASEYPSEILTKCLQCQAVMVLDEIRNLEDTDQKYFLSEQLEFGLLNLGHSDSNSNEKNQANELKNKLGVEKTNAGK